MQQSKLQDCKITQEDDFYTEANSWDRHHKNTSMLPLTKHQAAHYVDDDHSWTRELKHSDFESK